MIVEKDGSLYAVLFLEDGNADVYPLEDVMSTNVNYTEAGDSAEAAAFSAVDAFLDRHVVVDGEKYHISDGEHYTQITHNGEFFAESDWEGPMDDEDAIDLIRDQLNYLAQPKSDGAKVQTTSDKSRMVECGVCGGGGFLPFTQGTCPVCAGTQLISEERRDEILEELNERYRETIRVDGFWWSFLLTDTKVVAVSPGYPDFQLEYELDGSVYNTKTDLLNTNELYNRLVGESLRFRQQLS